MEVYLVGGAVRDQLLGLPPGERDWVVVGSTPEAMAAAGYRPVGRDFPVFLHPETGEEYALARLERKVGPGYRGFVTESSPEVTLEQDLQRRDLTINAMARGADDALIDPYGGQQDLQRRLLRHVSPAFSEDPVRILRAARFAARFGFHVAPDTLQLMRRMVKDGEADALVPERVWREFERALDSAHPQRFLDTLIDADALPVVLPELDALLNQEPQAARARAALQFASDAGAPAAVRFAALCATLPDADLDTLAQRLRLPNEYRELTALSARLERWLIGHQNSSVLDVDWLLELLETADAFRRPERFQQWLQVLLSRACADGMPADDAAALVRALDEAQRQAATAHPGDEDVARFKGARMAERLRELRRAALRALIGSQ